MHKSRSLGKLANLCSRIYMAIVSLEIEVRKSLLPFGEESFVFQVAIQKCKDQDI